MPRLIWVAETHHTAHGAAIAAFHGRATAQRWIVDRRKAGKVETYHLRQATLFE